MDEKATISRRAVGKHIIVRLPFNILSIIPNNSINMICPDYYNFNVVLASLCRTWCEQSDN